MASVPATSTVWLRIRAHAGEEFKTKTGLPFTYSVDGNTLTTDRTDYPLYISNFEKALELVPLEKVTELNFLVRGPAYVWAVLHDPRIRMSDW